MTTENNRLAAIFAAQRLHRLFTAVIVGNENVNNDGGISTLLSTLVKSGEEEAWKLMDCNEWRRVKVNNATAFTCKTKALEFNVQAHLMVNYQTGTAWLDINVPDKQVHASIQCSHLNDTLKLGPRVTEEIASLWGDETLFLGGSPLDNLSSTEGE